MLQFYSYVLSAAKNSDHLITVLLAVKSKRSTTHIQSILVVTTSWKNKDCSHDGCIKKNMWVQRSYKYQNVIASHTDTHTHIKPGSTEEIHSHSRWTLMISVTKSYIWPNVKYGHDLPFCFPGYGFFWIMARKVFFQNIIIPRWKVTFDLFENGNVITPPFYSIR